MNIQFQQYKKELRDVSKGFFYNFKAKNAAILEKFINKFKIIYRVKDPE